MKQSLDPESNNALQGFPDEKGILDSDGTGLLIEENGSRRSFGASEGSAANKDKYNPLLGEKDEALAALIVTSDVVLITSEQF